MVPNAVARRPRSIHFDIRDRPHIGPREVVLDVGQTPAGRGRRTKTALFRSRNSRGSAPAAATRTCTNYRGVDRFSDSSDASGLTIFWGDLCTVLSSKVLSGGDAECAQSPGQGQGRQDADDTSDETERYMKLGLIAKYVIGQNGDGGGRQSAANEIGYAHIHGCRLAPHCVGHDFL